MVAGRSDPAEPPRLGSVFGHYRLDALVGQGGMGVVFRATDLRLQRPVALKFLHPSLAADPAFQERFVRESRLAAAIEHPSIVPIYEAGTIEGSLFIAMRFVPGRDLGSLLRLEAPLELGRTLALLRQLADALDAAHRRGLVHRDVKPANVLVEQDDGERAYLVDFGLTRRLGEASASSRSGAVGTIDYVAPEQIEARSVDGRADQYALACLATHCLTGWPPFDLGSDAAVLYAHLHVEPARLRSIRPELPERVETALARALSKTPGDRFPDCRSFVAALVGPAGDLGTTASSLPTATTTANGHRRRLRRRSSAVAALVVAATVPLVAGALVLVPGQPPGPGAPTGGSSVAGASRGGVTDLRRGEVIVFASDVDGDWDIYALEAGQPEPRRLTANTRDDRSPAVSPDGRTIAYVVGAEPRRDIWLMDADGRNRRPLVTHPADDIDPAWSTDGRSLAFASERGRGGDADYEVLEMRDRGDGLSQADARNLTARPALESFPTWRPGRRQLAIASNYFGGNRDIVIIDADDRDARQRLTASYAFNLSPDYSPDGRAIAFVQRPFDTRFSADRGIPDVLVADARTGALTRLTQTRQRYELDPDWAPDGRALAYTAGTPSAMEIWVMSADGRRRRQLTMGWANAVEPAWGIVPDAPEDVALAEPT